MEFEGSTKPPVDSYSREQILENIEKSRLARESSNFGEYVKKEQEILRKIGIDTIYGVIETVELSELPENVQEAYKGYSKTNPSWSGNYKGQAEGTKAGRIYKNRDLNLPQVDSHGSDIIYKEFDINPKVGKTRDAERFVAGSDGRIYYTNDHYRTFKEIK